MRRILLPLVLALVAAPLLQAQPVWSQILHPQAPAVPEYVAFAGDTVRFDRTDFYERMDRELISFTYMHTNTTLMLKRSRRYFAQIVPILRQQGIPEDLKYLMAIESSLDPKALSVAGAAGLWQFTKATAQTYGLEVNTEVDERYNIEKETVAACKFLKDAYRKYGDWMTVAASYNAGQGGISKRREAQKQPSALELWLPEETARYMFRLLAVKMFFENPAAFGFNVPLAERYPYIEPKDVLTVNYPVPSLVDFALEHGTAPGRQADKQRKQDVQSRDPVGTATFLFEHQLLDEADRLVVGREELVPRKRGVHLPEKLRFLEGELVADDGGIERDVERAAAEIAFQREGAGAGAFVPGCENPLRIEPGGHFRGLDVLLDHLLHRERLFPADEVVALLVLGHYSTFVKTPAAVSK